MNYWLRRVSLVLPPAIIAGVYFNVIPVGQDIRKKFGSMVSEKKAPELVAAFPVVESVRGEVYVKDHPTFPAVSLKGGEKLKAGQSLATGPESFLLLSYQGSDSWMIKVAPDSRINIDELMEMKDSEETVINLLQGGLTFRMRNSTGALRKLLIRTKFASFAATGTMTAAVLTDSEMYSLITVHEGVAEAENFKLMEKTPVREAHTYLINREGDKKVVLDLDAIDLYSWDLRGPDHALPTIDKVLQSVGDLGPTLDDIEKKKLAQLRKIDGAVKDYKEKNEELRRELEILTENAVQSRAGLRAETVKVEKDIRCLETSEFECNLFSEKILLTRGFPKLWGNRAYRSSLVVGLGKYLQERNEEVSAREEEARILSKLMAAREAVLEAVEADRSAERNLDQLIPRLQDARLRR